MMTKNLSAPSNIEKASYSKDVNLDKRSDELASDPQLLLLEIRKKLGSKEIDDDLDALIKLWQEFVKQYPHVYPSHKDPFPEYEDVSEAGIPDIMARIDDLLGAPKSNAPRSVYDGALAPVPDTDEDEVDNVCEFIKANPNKEPNSRIEYINLFEQYSDFQMKKLESLQKDENDIYAEISAFDYLQTELSKLEAIARKNGKELELPDALLDKIDEFQTTYWPRLVERSNGLIPADRNPFEGPINLDTIATVKGRLNYLITEENHQLTKIVREIEKITRGLSNLLDIVAHHNVRDSFIDKCIRNQV